MVRDTLLGFPSHTLPYRGCEFSAFESVQILRRAFVSSLCLIPRRAPRLCWPVCQGKSVRLPCGSVRARRPTDIWEAGACRPMWASAPTKEHLVGRDPCVLPPTALHAACHCEAGAHTDCGDPRPPISGGLRAARPTVSVQALPSIVPMKFRPKPKKELVLSACSR